MPHESGITVSSELGSFIGSLADSSVRSFKVTVFNDSLILSDQRNVKGSFEEDFDSVQQYLEEERPAYILVRTEEKDDNGIYRWVMVFYCPDASLVRDKMVYASTGASLKRGFGSHLIGHEMFFNKKIEVNYKGYQGHIGMKNAPTPLTDQEALQQKIKSEEMSFASMSSSSSNLLGIRLGVNDQVTEAFDDFSARKINYVQLAVDLATEKIVVADKRCTSLEEISSITPDNEPRFHLYCFTHKHERSTLHTPIFIYSIPGFKCSIKQRMVYSSSKSSVIDSYEFGRTRVDKKIEVEQISEVTEEFLLRELHPPSEVPQKLFTKPKRPGR